jgi:CRISPR-associated protein Csd2
MSDALSHRYEFVYLFDVENGNPNGDPDAGNMPRVDPGTNHGLVTDVCLKRKIRNYVEISKGGQPPFEIYIKEKGVLNLENERAYTNNPEIEHPAAKKLPKGAEDARRITRWMCGNFYDIRTFGAVMTTEVNCGQVRGPVQINFARSIEPIVPLEISITRMAVTNERDLEKERTMGRKHIVPYALYRAEGYISAKLAEQTGFSDGDLTLLWEALINMFDHDHSAARGKMNARGLFVFKHDSALGNAPAHKLFSLVTVRRSEADNSPSRSFSDYAVAADRGGLPAGVALQEML